MRRSSAVSRERAASSYPPTSRSTVSSYTPPDKGQTVSAFSRSSNPKKAVERFRTALGTCGVRKLGPHAPAQVLAGEIEFVHLTAEVVAALLAWPRVRLLCARLRRPRPQSSSPPGYADVSVPTARLIFLISPAGTRFPAPTPSVAASRRPSSACRFRLSTLASPLSGLHAREAYSGFPKVSDNPRRHQSGPPASVRRGKLAMSRADAGSGPGRPKKAKIYRAFTARSASLACVWDLLCRSHFRGNPKEVFL